VRAWYVINRTTIVEVSTVTHSIEAVAADLRRVVLHVPPCAYTKLRCAAFRILTPNPRFFITPDKLRDLFILCEASGAHRPVA
jgi:hypothetical protein